MEPGQRGGAIVERRRHGHKKSVLHIYMRQVSNLGNIRRQFGSACVGDELMALKEPVVAGVLNLVPGGMGYLYLGRWRRFGATFLTAFVAFLVLVGALGSALNCWYETFGEVICSEEEETTILILGGISLFVLLLLVVFTVRDAERLARRHNEPASQSEPGSSEQ